jgi:hypothetical protein
MSFLKLGAKAAGSAYSAASKRAAELDQEYSIRDRASDLARTSTASALAGATAAKVAAGSAVDLAKKRASELDQEYDLAGLAKAAAAEAKEGMAKAANASAERFAAAHKVTSTGLAQHSQVEPAV